MRRQARLRERPMDSSSPQLLRAFAMALAIPTVRGGAAPAELYPGSLRDADGRPTAGAMVRFRAGDPAHGLTVYADEAGRFRSPALPGPGPWDVRVRRIGWKDLHAASPARDPAARLARVLEREDDPRRSPRSSPPTAGTSCSAIEDPRYARS
jgi:hypothetical protein